MKPHHLLLLSLILVASTGCFHPVSTIFDSAQSLEKGETSITLAGSANRGSVSSLPGVHATAIVDIGLSSNVDLRLRGERRFVDETNLDLGILGDFDLSTPYYFAEVAPKFSKNNRFAYSIPLQVYATDEGKQYFCMDPRFIFSLRSPEYPSEFNMVLRAQITVVDEDLVALPGACIGVRVGNDLDLGGLRLEVGLIPTAMTFGLGYQMILK